MSCLIRWPILTTNELKRVERMWNPEVRIDGDLATLWAPYDLHYGGEFSHCGIDAFQLVRGEDRRWRIVSVAYTRRTTGCSSAPEP